MSLSFEESITVIQNGINLDLPGVNAHQELMPERKSINSVANSIQENARLSAVLILIYPINKTPNIVFIQRHTYNGSHSNQIGLPGGKQEKNDDSLLSTALREANEELKIEKEKVEVIGSLTPLYIPPSNFIVHPFIGFQNEKPDFIPDAYEVKEVIELPLYDFIIGNAIIEQRIEVRKNHYMKVKGYPYKERIIWGATGMIMTELRQLFLKASE